MHLSESHITFKDKWPWPTFQGHRSHVVLILKSFSWISHHYWYRNYWCAHTLLSWKEVSIKSKSWAPWKVLTALPSSVTGRPPSSYDHWEYIQMKPPSFPTQFKDNGHGPQLPDHMFKWNSPKLNRHDQKKRKSSEEIEEIPFYTVVFPYTNTENNEIDSY